MGGASGRKIFEGFGNGNSGGSDILSKPWRKAETDFEWTEELMREIKMMAKEDLQITPIILLLGSVRTGKSSFVNSAVSICEGRTVGEAFTGGGENSYTRKHMKEIQIGKEQRDLQKTPNILLLGPIHTGKSSFVNSVVSICEGRTVGEAFTGGGKKSYTRKYVGDTGTDFQKFQLADTIGIIKQFGKEDFHEKYVIPLPKGKVKMNYEIDERREIFVLSTPDIYTTLRREVNRRAMISTIVQWQGKKHPEDIYPKQIMEKRAKNAALHDYDKIMRCSVCLDKVACIILFPCRHMTACESCADAVTHCPVCRSLIKGTVKVNVQ